MAQYLPAKSLIKMATPAEVPELSKFNSLRCQTGLKPRFDAKGLFPALSNRSAEKAIT
jgi:hypothetical protein